MGGERAAGVPHTHTHTLNQALSDLRPPGILVKNLSAKNCCQSHFLVISARAEAAPGD